MQKDAATFAMDNLAFFADQVVYWRESREGWVAVAANLFLPLEDRRVAAYSFRMASEFVIESARDAWHWALVVVEGRPDDLLVECLAEVLLTPETICPDCGCSVEVQH